MSRCSMVALPDRNMPRIFAPSVPSPEKLILYKKKEEIKRSIEKQKKQRMKTNKKNKNRTPETLRRDKKAMIDR